MGLIDFSGRVYLAESINITLRTDIFCCLRRQIILICHVGVKREWLVIWKVSLRIWKIAVRRRYMTIATVVLKTRMLARHLVQQRKSTSI